MTVEPTLSNDLQRLPFFLQIYLGNPSFLAGSKGYPIMVSLAFTKKVIVILIMTSILLIFSPQFHRYVPCICFIYIMCSFTELFVVEYGLFRYYIMMDGVNLANLWRL